MSDLLKTPEIYDSKDCPKACNIPKPILLPTRLAQIGDHLTIRRALPHPDRKMVGAWCFLDHFGPLNLKTGELDIAPHPHIGLQTFTWTIAGEILHRDSLGSEQVIQPGQVNLMTAGHGIAHSEQSVPDSVLHGLQLWIALPDSARHMKPRFNHYPSIPTVDYHDLKINILAGEFINTRSPVETFSPIVGLEINALKDSQCVIPLNPEFEYAALPIINNVEIANVTIDPETFLYFGTGHSALPIRAKQQTKFLLLGGKPFEEEVLIWWNFVARTKEEMLQAVVDWENHTRFGEVKDYQGGRLTPPPIKKDK